MLTPKRTKHRKMHKGRGLKRNFESRGVDLEYGAYGICSIDNKRITSRQIESARRVLLRFIRKGGKLWIRVFPDKPITKKPAEVPMGGGKGDVDHYVFQVRPGRIIFELDGIAESDAMKALKQISYKLPFRTKIIKR